MLTLSSNKIVSTNPSKGLLKEIEAMLSNVKFSKIFSKDKPVTYTVCVDGWIDPTMLMYICIMYLRTVYMYGLYVLLVYYTHIVCEFCYTAQNLISYVICLQEPRGITLQDVRCAKDVVLIQTADLLGVCVRACTVRPLLVCTVGPLLVCVQ